MKLHKIPFRPILQKDESPGSLLLRAAEGNGCSSIGQLLTLCGVKIIGIGSYRASFVDHHRFAQLLAALGLPKNYVSACHHTDRPTQASPRVVLGTSVPLNLLREDLTAFCPDCLAEFPYWRKFWLLRMYIVCHVHGVRLIQKCPECGSVPSLSRERLAFCQCGANWAIAEKQSADPSLTAWFVRELSSTNKLRLADGFEFWMALEKFDRFGQDFTSDFWRLRLFIAWIYRHPVCSNEIKKIVLSRSDHEHPRIQLIPFLERNAELNSFARQILVNFRNTSFKGNSLAPDQRVLHWKTAALALGVNREQLYDLSNRGLLRLVYGRTKKVLNAYLADIEHLLRSLQVTPYTPHMKLTRSPTKSLADLINSIRQETVNTLGYDLARGLNDLQATTPEFESNSQASDEFLDLKDAANIFGVHPQVVRSLVKKGHLAGCRQMHKGFKKLVFHREDISFFNETFVTAAAMASFLPGSRANIVAKLGHFGVKPIGGPKIDGLLVYLFRRSDLIDIDMNEVAKLIVFKSNAGRPPKTAIRIVEDGISLADATRRLGISIQQATRLVSYGVLQKIPSITREIRVTTFTVECTYEILFSGEYLQLRDAAKAIQMDYRIFLIRYIESEILEINELYLWRYIKKTEFLKIKELEEKYITVREASALFGMHRGFLVNIERRGQISSKILGPERTIKFYKRADVKKLADKLGVNIDLEPKINFSGFDF